MNILLILNAKGDISKSKTFFLTTHTQKKAILKYPLPGAKKQGWRNRIQKMKSKIEYVKYSIGINLWD